VTEQQPNIDAYNREAVAAREEIRRRAFEQYVLALAKGSEVGTRLWHKHGMDGQAPLGSEIREVKLEGEYPETAIELRIYRSDLDKEEWHRLGIWAKPPDGGDGLLVDANDRPLPNTERLVGDLLMNTTGG
jgi:hypothetical protein